MSEKITPGRRVTKTEEIREPGDWLLTQSEYDKAIGVALFEYKAPDGTVNTSHPSGVDHIYIRTGEKQDGYWQWDGNVEAPTIAPSIFHRGQSSWHGFFEGGNWRTL